MVQKTIEPEKARQGRRGWQVLAILVCGLILSMIAWYAAETLAPHTDQQAPAATQPTTSN